MPNQRQNKWEVIAAFAFGVTFLTAILVLAVLIPNPTQQQYETFRTVLALAGGGCAVVIPGLLQIKLRLGIRAGGALAVFVILYFFSPAALVTEVKADYVDPLKDYDASAFKINSRTSVLDLTTRQELPKPVVPGKSSFVQRTTTLNLTRNSQEEGFYKRHILTSETEPTVTTSTHAGKLKLIKDRDYLPTHGQVKLKRYIVEVDISDHAIGEPFDLSLSTKTYNTLQGQSQEWMAEYIRHACGELDITILFPESKPFIDYKFSFHPKNNHNASQLVEDTLSRDDGLLLNWRVNSPKLGHVYKIDWWW